MEHKINFRRKSQKILDSVIPATQSYDQLLRTKLVCGKFPVTKTGLVKSFGLLILLAAFSLFMALPICDNTGDWYPYVFPISTGISISVQLILYLIFSFGVTVKHPLQWIKTDVVVNLFSSILTIISSVLTNIDCVESEYSNKIPSILGIVGAVVVIISCGGIVLMYRHKDEAVTVERRNPDNYRYSIHV